MDQLTSLYEVIASRKGGDASSSYTASLFAKGMDRITQKCGEEAFETVIAALHKNSQAVVAESADLLYHLLVLWAELNIHPDEVMAELSRREGVSGIAEKQSRK
ncbi:MAG: phosphoribosyl-ATP diphosphatase [Alphaproteobacteria bacterium]|nr:phosphoribosyl-ATP diphosphatase [Alphaproteobacteria bacterium]